MVQRRTPAVVTGIARVRICAIRPVQLDYRLIKELWTFGGNRIGLRYAYEWHDDSRNWFRSYGNENCVFGEDGLMTLRHARINDLPIKQADRKFRWLHGGLSRWLSRTILPRDFPPSSPGAAYCICIFSVHER